VSIKVQQDSTRKGDRWNWSVWLEGTKEELDEIKRVRYVLHSSFRDPERIVEKRRSKFRLEAQALGEFMLYIFIHKKNGQVSRREHWVKLLQDEAGAKGVARKRPTAKDRPPAVFISSSVTELPLVRKLGEALKTGGVEVLIPSDAPTNLPWEASLNTQLERADCAVFILSGATGKWVEREIAAAEAHKKQLLPVVLIGPDGKAQVPPQLQNYPALHVKMPPQGPSGDAAIGHELARLAKRIKEML
jgi:TIR domain/YEATS family